MNVWQWWRAQWLRPESRNQMLVVGGALVLLPLLAALQYRWLGQVSDGEREFTKSKLRTQAENLSQDFDQRLTRLNEALRSEVFTPDSFSPTAQTAALARFKQWSEASPEAQFVNGFYLLQPNFDNAGDLVQFALACGEVAQQKFNPCDWPTELQPLREQLEMRLGNFSRAMAGKEPLMPARFPEGLLGNIPAFVFLLPNRPPNQFFMRGFNQPGTARLDRRPAAPPQPFPLPFPGHVVVVSLNVAYIRSSVLPALVQRHFGSDAQNYDLAVQRRQPPPTLIFATNENVDYHEPDVTVTLFGLQQDLLRTLFRERWLARNPAPQTPNQAPGETGPPRPGPGSAGQENTQDLRPPNQPIPMVMPLDANENSGQWQLLIKHRAGSLAVAVANVRRRNLLISFGVLLLLTASLALLLSSARRAERLAQAQMDFVAGVSHELRTPISVIDAAGYNLTRGHIKDAEQMARYGHLIRQESRRLTEMVEQILEFAGAQSKKPHYDLQPTDLKEVIATVLATPLLAESDFAIEQRLPAELPLVLADAPALQRALQNLLNNAVKYSGESRWIQIQAEAATSRHTVQLTVRDRGLGIPAQELPHIFEPFFRGQEGRAAQIHGNGLGLSLVKNIIEAHGGRIAVTSEPGRGSAFTLSLPAATEQYA